MAILKDHEREYVEKVFKLVENKVALSFFTNQPENQAGRETQEILEEISSISDMIKLTIFDFEKDNAAVDKYKIDKVPATVVEGENDLSACCIPARAGARMGRNFIYSHPVHIHCHGRRLPKAQSKKGGHQKRGRSISHDRRSQPHENVPE